MYLKIAKLRKSERTLIDFFCILPNELQFYIGKFLGKNNTKVWLDHNFPILKIHPADSVIKKPVRTQPPFRFNYKMLSKYLDFKEPIQNIKSKKKENYTTPSTKNKGKKYPVVYNSEKYQYNVDFWNSNYYDDSSESESESESEFYWNYDSDDYRID